ncbi:MAG TPA: YceI family protein [Gammaproteobacteria bacterium]|nr:YceI family protein [Gammaproteobacteria bacterium]
MRRAILVVCLTLLGSGVAHAQQAGQRYVVDQAQSDFHWLVYKAGSLSRLGHNHTIATGDLTGSVTVNEQDRNASQFELSFNVANLVVDDPMLRATLGADFESVPTADDIAGTRKNMLTDKVLDGEKYPSIRILGTGPVGSAGKQELKVKVELLGRTVDLTVPTEVTIAGNEVRAKGEFELTHADLGMKPFSVMLGALQVGENLSFTYDIRARR